MLKKEEVIVYSILSAWIGTGLVLLLMGWQIGPQLKALALLIPGVFVSSSFLWFFFLGFKIIQPEERAIVEVLGAYHKECRPGLIWVCPFFMQRRATVDIWDQSLVLFENKPISIDFRDASAEPKGVEAFVRILNPDQPYSIDGEVDTIPRTGVYRSVYRVDEWDKRLIGLLENVVRSYLATLTLDEALEQRRGGFNLLQENRLPPEEKSTIEETLNIWGLKLLKVVVTDYTLDPKVVAAREDVHQKRREADAAEHMKIIRATEITGSLNEMMAQLTGMTVDELQAHIKNNPELFRARHELVVQLLTRRMSLDRGALADIRTEGSGAGELEQVFQRLIVLGRGGLPGTSPGQTGPVAN